MKCLSPGGFFLGRVTKSIKYFYQKVETLVHEFNSGPSWWMIGICIYTSLPHVLFP